MPPLKDLRSCACLENISSAAGCMAIKPRSHLSMSCLVFTVELRLKEANFDHHDFLQRSPLINYLGHNHYHDKLFANPGLLIGSYRPYPNDLLLLNTDSP